MLLLLRFAFIALKLWYSLRMVCFKGLFAQFSIQIRKSAFAPNARTTSLDLFHQRHCEHAKTLKKFNRSPKRDKFFFASLLQSSYEIAPHVAHSAASFQRCASLGKMLSTFTMNISSANCPAFDAERDVPV
jgi:hypothetical protein